MEKELNLTLPEWVFLDGNSHMGDALEGRTVLEHVQSFTILEMIALEDDATILNPTPKVKEFTYSNIFGEDERHLILVHFSLIDDSELSDILDKAIEFYKLFMDWEDNILIIEETSKDN